MPYHLSLHKILDLHLIDINAVIQSCFAAGYSMYLWLYRLKLTRLMYPGQRFMQVVKNQTQPLQHLACCPCFKKMLQQLPWWDPQWMSSRKLQISHTLDRHPLLHGPTVRNCEKHPVEVAITLWRGQDCHNVRGTPHWASCFKDARRPSQKQWVDICSASQRLVLQTHS